MTVPVITQYPDVPWDGGSADRNVALDGVPPIMVFRAPSAADWATITAELMAVQVYAVLSTFRLDALQPQGQLTVTTTGTGTTTLDASLYDSLFLTLAHNQTLAITNLDVGRSVRVAVIAGAHTLTLPAGVLWADATPPTLSVDGTIDQLEFTRIASGTLLGRVLSQGHA